MKTPTSDYFSHIHGFKIHGWLRRMLGLDHGVGHALLLLDDAKVPNCQRSKEFKDLGPYPSDASRSMIES
jgi:hypothetical protein